MSLLRNRRVIVAATSAVAVLVIVAGMMLATGSMNPAVAFAPTGHWVANRAENSVVHVDSGTGQVDARVAVPGGARDTLLTVQGQDKGFLVGRDTITTFGKSSLTVENSFPTGQTEVPYAIETIGGPYLVYRTAGTIVRLGETPTSIAVGGSVDRPVNTDDGTIWVHRPDDGSVCSLTSAQAALGCPVNTRPGNAGALTVLSGVAEFLDTGADAFQSLTGTSTGTPAGVDLPDDALVGDRDTQGRLPVLVSTGNRLLLLDTSGAPEGRAGGPPTTIELGPGRFTSPAAADGIVAIIEQAQNLLLTFRVDGTKISTVQLPPGEPPILTRGGDGRLYIDDANGTTTHIVNPDGSVTSVETGGVVTVGAPPVDQIELVSLPRLPSGPPRIENGPGQTQLPVDGPPMPGPQAPPVEPPPVLVGRPGPPSGLAVTGDVGNAGRELRMTAQWSAPASLNGGTLDHYEYTITDKAGKRLATGQAQQPTFQFSGGDYCLAPNTVSVVAVTVGPDRKQYKGDPATTTSTYSKSCGVSVTLSEGASTTKSVTIAMSTSSTDTLVDPTCTLLLNGATKWSGSCGPRLQSSVTIDGLLPGKTYSAVMRINQVTGGSTSSNTASVSTSSPVKGDINRDGNVDQADLDTLQSQWDQTGPGLSGDLNGDNKVDLKDMSILLSNWGK